MRNRHWMISILLAAALWACACNVNKKASGTVAAAETTSEREAALFQVPKNQLDHLKIVEVQRASWSPAVRTTGTVDWDADF